jgi:hypothetical protein
MQAARGDARERGTAGIPDFIVRSKIKPAPEGTGFEILH